jgi:hypothetical protein
MKTKTLQSMALSAALGFLSFGVTAARAADAEKEEVVKIPATVDGIWKAIHEHHMALAATVKSKKLDEVHMHAFAIRDVANALSAKTDDGKKSRVDGALKNISKLADDLDKSGDAGDQAATEANLKKLDGVLKVLEAQFSSSSMPAGHKHK